ncbi:MAG: B12-binding domain-containing radical SAM protein [Tepidisphaeraceae bacterium]
MNALLLYPEFPDTFWSLKHALRFIRKRATSPPLGLITVAAMLPAGWDKRLIDVNVSKLDDRDLAWADIVLISGMTVQRESACQLIERCKRAGVTVVAGGPLFTGEPDRFPQVDHLVLNEAELTLPPFLADLEQGRAKRVYSTEQFADVRNTPPPLWRIADLRRYATMSIQFSRGCPFDCEFCNVTALFGRKPRTKSARQVIAELNDLYDLGWRGPVFFVDDNLIGNKKELRTTLLPALIEWRKGRRGFAFNTQVSINLADDEPLMGMMADAGFDSVFIGIETPDNDSLLECSKVQNKNRDMVADVKRIQRAGMQVQGGFIVGFDSDRPSIFQRQIDFIQASGIVTAMVGLLQAPPGTRLLERMRHEGRLLGSFTGDNVDGTTNIAPLMGLQALREGYARILNHIYSPKSYYARVRTFLREFRTPTVGTPLGPQRILAVARSVVRLGVIGRERLQFWRLMWWTLLHRPRLFGRAVTLAISGYHFRRVCQAHVS